VTLVVKRAFPGANAKVARAWRSIDVGMRQTAGIWRRRQLRRSHRKSGATVIAEAKRNL
jgi:hypothetical protein